MPKKMKKKLQNIDDWLDGIGLKWRRIEDGNPIENSQTLTEYLQSQTGKKMLLEYGGEKTSCALLVGIGEFHLMDIVKLSRYLDLTPKFNLISSTFYEEIKIKKGYPRSTQQVELLRKAMPMRVSKNYANSPLEIDLKSTTTAMRIMEWSDEGIDELIEGFLIRGLFDPKQKDRTNLFPRIFDEVYRIKEEVNEKMHLIEVAFELRIKAIYNQIKKGEFIR